TNGRLFVNMGPGSSDGIRCDTDGNVWAAAGWGGNGYNGVHVFAPDGTLIGKIHLPETCANLWFGGAKKNRLFMTASQSLYAVSVKTQGPKMPGPHTLAENCGPTSATAPTSRRRASKRALLEKERSRRAQNPEHMTRTM